MMKRSDYKVAVSSKKQAKQFKQALLAVGEELCPNYYEEDERHGSQDELIYDGDEGNGAWLCYNNGNNLKEITFKELLTLIVNDVEEVKSGFLDGKCAIQVNNEREFKLLMEHYESKGWRWCGKEPVLPISELTHNQLSVYNYNTNVMYQDEFLFNVADKESWNIIPFSDFAKEVGIKVPVFIQNSVDGVDLYEGDIYTSAWFENDVWVIAARSIRLSMENAVVTDPSVCKAFSTKEAADRWIAEQNKLKELECKLFGRKTANIHPNLIRIFDGNNTVNIMPSDLEDMLHAYKQLNVTP